MKERKKLIKKIKKEVKRDNTCGFSGHNNSITNLSSGSN